MREKGWGMREKGWGMRERNESATWHVQSQRHTRMHVVVLHVHTYVCTCMLYVRTYATEVRLRGVVERGQHCSITVICRSTME